MDLIVDTTTLSNFALINRLDILEGVAGKICITREVIQEIKMCTARSVLPAVDLNRLEIIDLIEEDNVFFHRLKEAEDILSEMIKRGFYSPIKNLDEMEKDR
jgi:predicted nucleic acid-binding protein